LWKLIDEARAVPDLKSIRVIVEPLRHK
jgi:hypothetical protein